MFYEAFAIINLLKCELCSQTCPPNDESPTILPCCSKTVCTECFRLTNHTIDNIFKCSLCNKQSQMPNYGFVINDLAIKLAAKQPATLCITTNEENAKISKQTDCLFYEATFIRNLLKCSHCNESFNEYEEPRILPCCFKTLCAKCIHSTESSVKYNSFKCLVCSQETQIPSRSFLVNDLAARLVSLQPVDVCRDVESDSLKTNLLDLETSVKNLIFEINNGEHLIKEHCNEQRRLIQLSTEQRIQNIYTASDILIQRVNDYESECMHTYSTAKECKQRIVHSIKQSEELIEKQKAYLGQLCISEQEIKVKSAQLKEVKASVENEKLNAQKLLFTDKIMEFEMRKNSTVETSLGRFRFQRIDLNLKV